MQEKTLTFVCTTLESLLLVNAVIITLGLYLRKPSLRGLVSSPCHDLAMGRAWNSIELKVFSNGSASKESACNAEDAAD